MANVDVNNTPSTVAPVFKDRLAEALETAQRLQDDADALGIDTFQLFYDLKEIAAEGEQLDSALDTVAWLDRAVTNARCEFAALADHLDDAVANAGE
jgi:hypothetical protein